MAKGGWRFAPITRYCQNKKNYEVSVCDETLSGKSRSIK